MMYWCNDDCQHAGIVTTNVVYVLCNIAERSRYHYYNGNAKMNSVCVVELHVAVTLHEDLCAFMIISR